MLNHTRPDHRFFHTLVGASLVGIAVAVGLAVVAPVVPRPRWRWLEEDLQWTPLWVGGLFGGLSHALLDSTYHHDAMPFWPWTRVNPLVLPHHFAPEFCLATGALGLAIVAWRIVRRSS